MVTGLSYRIATGQCSTNSQIIYVQGTMAVLGFTFGGQWGGHNCSWGHGPILPQ